MNIKEKVGKGHSFLLILEDYYGSGWINSTIQAIENNIKPKSFEKMDLEVGWYSSEYEIIFEKDDLKVKIEVDDFGPIGIILKENVTEESKQKLREWATIIAEEIERLKNV